MDLVAHATGATRHLEIPRSLYLHVPFCARRCGYCHFALEADRRYLVDRYLDALEREIQQYTDGAAPAHALDTVFLGGGTPTYLSTAQLERLMQRLLDHFRLEPQAEVTIEANPDDVHPDLARALAALRVNRVSLGVQSFDHAKLRSLDRQHTPEQIERSCRLLRSSFDNVSIDLIFGAPSESANTWREDVRRALALRPQHVSTYELTYEKGTAFWSQQAGRQRRGLDDEQLAEMYEQAIESFTSEGYEHYEVSSFCLRSRRCRHNEVYWTGKPYLAFGAGAASFVNSIRQVNHSSVRAYIRRIENGQEPAVLRETVAPRQAAVERLVFGLRRLQGIDIDRFEAETGFALHSLAGREIERLSELGLLDCAAGHLRFSRRGLMQGDYVCAELLAAGSTGRREYP